MTDRPTDNRGATKQDVLAGGGEMGALMRSLDWGKTTAGAPETWPQSLRTALSILLESRFPMYIAWGPTFLQFYNDGYRPVLGSTKHPAAMGLSAQVTFAESWHIIGPMFEGVRAGNAVGAEDWMLPLDRHGYLEECYFTFSYSPIRDESGGVGGVLVTVTETTGRVLGERRMRTLRDLAARAGSARREEDAWRGAAEALTGNTFDTPFALLYRLDEPTMQVALVARAGMEKAATSPQSGLFDASDPELARLFTEASTTPGGALVTELRARYGELPGGAWPEAAESALVLPIARAGTERPYGYLVAGLSPRRALDDDYRGFVRLAADQIATAVGNARAHEEEKRRAEALAEIDRTKTTFFNNVSHELRTPLTLMLGPVEDALAETEHPLAPTQRQRLELVERNGRRLRKLVNTLLDFARLEAGRTQARFVPTDLAALTRELASSFESAFATAAVTLHVDCPELAAPVFVDPTMWEKIVLNLLSNALKFTLAGEVRVSLRALDGEVVLTVADTGIGIPAAELPRVFERFHRVEGARGRSHEGTGIGLALVLELTKLHGGNVDVRSAVSQGTTATVHLKAGSAHLPADQVASDPTTVHASTDGSAAFLAEVAQWDEAPTHVPAAAPMAGDASASTTQPARILVADDNADMRGYVTRLLSARWAVETASDGAQALRAAQDRPPDLVVADVMMPGMDGLSLVRALRNDERTRTIPVMLLSARAGEEATIEGLASGADEYLPKPFSANELVARVDAQLSVSRLRRQSIAAERAHAAEATRLLAEAERATQARQETLAVVSHDLRTPLSAIDTAAQLIARQLGDGERDASLKKRTDVIRRSVNRMNRLVRDLLDAASIDAGTLSIDPRAMVVGDLARDLREAFDAEAMEKQVTLTFSVAPGAEMLTGDHERVFQVLSNLVSNALKFAPSGGNVHVAVDREPSRGEIRFVVEDDGPGIPAPARLRVFDRFWRGTHREGHGLGLAIAKGIVEGHGGRIGLDDASVGSRFWFTLPDEGPTRRSATPRPSQPVPEALATTDESFVQRGGECGRLIRAHDWSKTSLGPMARWPQSLRTSVSTMLRSPYPIILFWGRDLVMLYNDPFCPILGEKHPATVGASGREALAEAWDILGPLMAKVLATGEPLFVENGAVFFARMPGRMREEAYFTWSYNPTIGEAGEIAGLFAIASETTRQVVGDRRLGTLRELSLRTAYDKQIEGAFRSVSDVLAQAGADVPFALFYVVEGDRARLVSCAGLERGARSAPGEIDLAREDARWPLATIAREGQSELVVEIPAADALPGGPWPEPTTRALLLAVPIGPDAKSTGVLVAGVSPRLPLDDEYRSFLQLLARQISAGLSSARAYEEETQRAEKLAALDRAKTDFFSNVSHEFRTPLTLILGPVEDALTLPTPKLDGARLELVRRNALRLYKLVNTLLDFSRIEAGRAQATFVPIDLASYTTNLASHFQSAAASAGLELVVDCPKLPEPVFVDPEMWEKIVLNMLSNAIKYTLRGTIRVTLAWAGDAAVLTVDDTGVGIGESDLAHVFDRFYRVSGAQGRSHEGTGIGLALARELVELHGGAMSVASKLGQGTTFTARVPRGSAHLAPERIGRASQAAPVATAAAPFVEEALRWSTDTEAFAPPGAEVHDDATPAMPAPLVPARILLVDDNADLRAYVAGLLGRVFPHVETATNGREALEIARARPPDLVVSDVMMPVMDGFELVRALREDERTRSVPIILLSARAGDESKVEGLDSGADDYLVKPFSSRELLARVRSQLEMSRIRAEVWTDRARIQELLRSAAVRDEFLSILAHELRTPVTALALKLQGLLRLVRRAPAESSERRYGDNLEIAVRQTERLTRLFDTLLDASRVALGQLVLEPQELDLPVLVRRAVARVEAEAHARGTTFAVESSPVVGQWDRRRIEEVVDGLLSNAMKYAPGTRVDIAVRARGDAAELVVRDRGMGIEPEVLRRVFDRFERGVSVDHYGGFGIGLYLARQIVEAHGGTLRAESSPQRGSTFTVTLPAFASGPQGVAPRDLAVERG